MDKLKMLMNHDGKMDSYRELADFNSRNKECRKVTPEECEEKHRHLLKNTKKIRAVTVCFSNIEGRLHMLDYDKDFLLASADNLTFDGSSIRGFTSQAESDLRLEIDWPAFYILPWDVFGEGKAFVFANIRDKDGGIYWADMRSTLQFNLNQLAQKGWTVGVATEIEGFLLKGKDAERRADLRPVTSGGYYDSLPGDEVRSFIDQVAEVQRAIGFRNEKDHPEVGPSQFEINWGYEEALIAADQIQLYKLSARQVARQLGFTACFLPKPVAGINGNGMHTNISMSRDGKNIFHDAKGQHGLSNEAQKFMIGILDRAEDLCLIMNSSVNAYRRLDPAYEAPNAIFASAVDRGAMIRIPLANENTARLEVRAVSPDANPYLLILALITAGNMGPPVGSDRLECRMANNETTWQPGKAPDPLPSDIYTAIEHFEKSKFIRDLLGEENQTRYAKWKKASADRCPRILGNLIKDGEILFHHEVTNQAIWSNF